MQHIREKGCTIRKIHESPDKHNNPQACNSRGAVPASNDKKGREKKAASPRLILSHFHNHSDRRKQKQRKHSTACTVRPWLCNHSNLQLRAFAFRVCFKVVVIFLSFRWHTETQTGREQRRERDTALPEQQHALNSNEKEVNKTKKKARNKRYERKTSIQSTPNAEGERGKRKRARRAFGAKNKEEKKRSG